MKNKIAIFSIIIFIAAIINLGVKALSNENKKQLENQKNIEINQEKDPLNGKIYDQNELKSITNLITEKCNNKEHCEIESIFKYVTEKPYEISDKDRLPHEVIDKGGDCDEKAYLMASMLNMRGYESIVLYTVDHAFLAVKVRSFAEYYPNAKKIQYENKIYLYAETTATGSYIGWDNGIGINEIIAIYDVKKKQLIKKEKLEIYG